MKRWRYEIDILILLYRRFPSDFTGTLRQRYETDVSRWRLQLQSWKLKLQRQPIMTSIGEFARSVYMCGCQCIFNFQTSCTSRRNGTTYILSTSTLFHSFELSQLSLKSARKLFSNRCYVCAFIRWSVYRAATYIIVTSNIFLIGFIYDPDFTNIIVHSFWEI